MGRGRDPVLKERSPRLFMTDFKSRKDSKGFPTPSRDL